MEKENFCYGESKPKGIYKEDIHMGLTYASQITKGPYYDASAYTQVLKYFFLIFLMLMLLF